MIRNYFKIALRNLWKNKLFSLINVLSLAIGLSASFVIGLMAYYDFTFDTFHKDKDLIYRITTIYNTPEGEATNYGVTLPLNKEVKHGISGIDLATSFITTEHIRVMHPSFSKEFNNPDKIIYADPEYFKLFEYTWLAGNSSTAFQNPNEVILTERRAKKYFPIQAYSDIIGETLTYDDTVAVTVSGIVANFKKRTDLIFEEFISLETANQTYLKSQVNSNNWNNTNSNSQLFVKLTDPSVLENLQNQLDKLALDHKGPNADKYNVHRKFYLQPLRDIHLNDQFGVFDFTPDKANKKVLISLLFIAAFILTLGCINFVNLNTAQATQRAKEIGIRKTLGSSKKQLVIQFLGETFLITILAAILSLVLAAGLLKVFSDFIPNGVRFSLFYDPVIFGLGIVLVISISLLSGFYPALIMSSFRPISVLKNNINPKSRSDISLRKVLIIFQFIIAQVFVISTIIVGNQIHFLMSTDMGFKTDAVAYIKTPWRDGSIENKKLFFQKIKSISQVQKLSLGGSPPASFSTISTEVDFKDGEKAIHTSLELLYGDDNYLDVYDIKLLAGRKRLNDSSPEYIINETYRKLLGFKSPQQAIGHSIIVGDEIVPIAGVMEDFNQRSLKSKIEPMALMGNGYGSQHFQFNTIHFQLNKANAQNWTPTIAKIRSIWKSIYPKSDFHIDFMDETVSNFYKSEMQMTKLLKWATGLSILLSCLGLLGLVIYTTERRIKEVGVRKVLGASILQINNLLCKDFIVLVLVAFIIAVPIAWYSMERWLEGYAFKTGISLWIFILSGLGMLLLTLVVMSLKTISMARTNPVNSLRTE